VFDCYDEGMNPILSVSIDQQFVLVVHAKKRLRMRYQNKQTKKKKKKKKKNQWRVHLVLTCS
jgi:hypothetical protein